MFLKEQTLIKCIVCHCKYFLGRNFNFQSLHMAIGFKVEILFVKGIEYRIHISGVGKSEIINKMKDFDLNENSIFSFFI